MDVNVQRWLAGREELEGKRRGERGRREDEGENMVAFGPGLYVPGRGSDVL